jgi:hypothetical protein
MPLFAMVVFATALSAGAARADDAAVVPPVEPPPNPNTVPSANPMSLFGSQRGAGSTVGFGRIGNSWYFQLDPFLQLNFGKLGLAVQVPLDLLSPLPVPTAADKASAIDHVIYRQDFPRLTVDTYGHYLAMIRMVRWGEPSDPFYFQWGQFLGETIGHGTVVDRYDNALDPNNPKAGLAFAVNTDYAGGEVFTDNLAWPSTELLAGRLYVRPLAIAGMGTWAKKWAVGVTFADDRTAPEGESPGAFESAGPPFATGSEVLPTRPAMVIGVDTEYRLLDTSVLSLTPYVDLNDERTQAGSWGLHVGVLGRFAIPIANAVRIWARLEYRLMQPGYIPDYFDAIYDVQRGAYPVSSTLLVDKAAAALYLAPEGPQGLRHMVHGIYGEATVDVLSLVQAGATFSAIPQVPESGNLMVFATLPHLGPVKVSAYYLHENFATTKDFFTLDDHSSLSGIVMYDIVGPLWVYAAITRTWVADAGSDGAVHYDPLTTESFGLEVYAPF